MKKLFAAVFVTLLLLVSLLLYLTPSKAATIQQNLYNEKVVILNNGITTEQYITRTMSSQYEETQNDFRAMQKRAVERNIRSQTYTEKKTYVADNCDYGMKSVQWVQKHCNDKDM